MGWFWQTPPQSPKAAPANPQTQQNATGSSIKSTQQQQEPQKSSDDVEIAKFLQLFYEADGSTPSPNPSQQSSTAGQQQSSPQRNQAAAAATQQSSSAFLSKFSRPFREDPSGGDASPSRKDLSTLPPDERAKEEIVLSLMPTDISCRDAFDYAFACNSMRGQFNAVYRYGEVRSCSELWDNFFFCMRVRTWQPEMRSNAIRDRWRAREERKYGPGMPSSEDVWRPRLQLLGPGEAFSERIPEAPSDHNDDDDDMEWSRRDLEQRRALREKMGLKGDGY